jgi:hypothetical protein
MVFRATIFSQTTIIKSPLIKKCSVAFIEDLFINASGNKIVET